MCVDTHTHTHTHTHGASPTNSIVCMYNSRKHIDILCIHTIKLKSSRPSTCTTHTSIHVLRANHAHMIVPPQRYLFIALVITISQQLLPKPSLLSRVPKKLRRPLLRPQTATPIGITIRLTPATYSRGILITAAGVSRFTLLVVVIVVVLIGLGRGSGFLSARGCR